MLKTTLEIAVVTIAVLTGAALMLVVCSVS